MFGFGAQLKVVVWLIVAACVLSVFAGVYYKGRLVEREVWQVKVDREAKARAETELKAQVSARMKEISLTRQIEEQNHARQKEIDDITNNHRRIVAGLRQRLSRPRNHPTPASTDTAHSEGCTGAELHREDGEFLAGEATRGDVLRAELTRCYDQYDKVRTLLNGEVK